MKNTNPRPGLKSVSSAAQRPFVWFGAALAILYGLGAYSPGSLSWGLHLLGFYQFGVQLAALVLFLFLLSGRGQAVLLGLFEWLSRFTMRGFFPSFVYAVLITSLALLFWYAREQSFFLGDGNLILRTLPNISKLQEVVIAYRNEPFAGWIVWKLYRLMLSAGVAKPAEHAFQAVSIVF